MSIEVKEKLQSLSIDRSAYARSSGKGKLWLLGGAFGVAGVSVALLLGSQPSGQAVAAAPSASKTEMAIARVPAKGTVASGYVVARRSATVSADITGRLTRVHFEEGALVKQGQVLAELDDGLARYDLELAQARLQSSRATAQAVEADLIEGEAQLRRAEQLMRTSTISPVALDNAKTRIQALTARHEAALADARVAQVAVDRQSDFIERHKIRAPFSSVIIAENATLRAIGFGRISIFAGAMTEAIILSLAGALIASVVALAVFNGMSTSTLGEGFTQVVFQFSVGPEQLMAGVALALTLGVAGGFFPALKAATAPVLKLGA